MFHKLCERLAARYAEGEHQPEAARARAEYLDRSGKVFDDDGDLFEQRMTAFLEWYVIERPLGGGPPPAVRALSEDAGLDDGERRGLAWLAASHRSVFDLQRKDGSVLYVEDVIGGVRFSVVERRSTVGFNQGDLFEARLWWDGQSVAFGKTFLFHPHEAREEALRVVDGALARDTPRDEITFMLSRLYVRWHRFGHVSAAKVYGGHA